MPGPRPSPRQVAAAKKRIAVAGLQSFNQSMVKKTPLKSSGVQAGIYSGALKPVGSNTGTYKPRVVTPENRVNYRQGQKLPMRSPMSGKKKP